ncbi:MAG: hypothetical protein QM640_00165 [Niabella sp.]
MEITRQQIQELEDCFKNVDVPMVMKLNPGVTSFNTPQFIQDSLISLKEGTLKGFYAEVRYDDLLHIKKLLEEDEAAKQKQ